MKGLDYACAQCRKTITDWTIIRLPNGKLLFTAHCHGERYSFVGIYDAGGVLFSGKDVMELDNRDPDYWRRV
jgi:hypothetical protein